MYIHNFTLVVEAAVAPDFKNYCKERLKAVIQNQTPGAEVKLAELVLSPNPETASFVLQFRETKRPSGSWQELRKQLLINEVSENFPYQVFCFDTLMEEL